MIAAQLAAGWPLHMTARVTHARRGRIRHAFRYGVDYVLLLPERASGPRLFSVNRLNLASYHDRDHGGPRGGGSGAAWARRVLASAGLETTENTLLALLTQPRFLGNWFSPVSFWLAFEAEDLVAVIAEVNNTFGDRHSYLCHRPDFAPITVRDELAARKVFHVSPFQDIAGSYHFRFDLADGRVAVRIRQIDQAEGLIAVMVGCPEPLRNRHILAAALRRPLGPLRTLALIHWHALRLKLKGAAYRPRPAPPDQEVSS